MTEAQYLDRWWASKLYSAFRTSNVKEAEVFRKLVEMFRPQYWPSKN